jgi:hypothetical protein
MKIRMILVMQLGQYQAPPGEIADGFDDLPKEGGDA